MSKSIIIRRKHHANFSVYGNEMLRDCRLTWPAQGLLTFLLSLHPDKPITLEYLALQRPDGRHATRSAISTLEKTGYLRITKPKDAKGRFQAALWEIDEYPKERPESGFLHVDTPPTDDPQPVEQSHINTTKTKSTNIKKTTTHHMPTHDHSCSTGSTIAMPKHLDARLHEQVRQMLSALPDEASLLMLTALDDALTRKAIKTTPIQWLAGVIRRYREGKFNPIPNKSPSVENAAKAPTGSASTRPARVRPQHADDAIASLRNRLKRTCDIDI